MSAPAVNTTAASKPDSSSSNGLPDPYVFILRTFNDIDQITPVIWKLCSAGEPTMVLFADNNGNIDIKRDARLRFLISQGCRVQYFYAAKGASFRLPNKLMNQPENPVVTKLWRLFRSLMFNWVWTPAWAERVLRNLSPRVVATDEIAPTEADIEGRLILAAHRLRIPTVSLPHGPSAYHSFSADEKHIFRPVRKTLPIQKEFDIFDHIVSRSAPEVEEWVRQGFSRDKVWALGSPRYCPEWLSQTETFLPTFSSGHPVGDRLKVVFLMPHWGPSVDRDATLRTIEMLAGMSNIYLVIKEHTREGAGDLPGDLRTSFSRRENIEVIRSTRSVSTVSWIRSGFKAQASNCHIESSALIRWADVAICFATSIGIEAVTRGKLVIDPVYLYRHASLYEAFNCAKLVRGESQLRDLLSGWALSSGKADSLDREGVERMRHIIIQGGRSSASVLDEHVRFFKLISGGSSVKRLTSET